MSSRSNGAKPSPALRATVGKFAPPFHHQPMHAPLSPDYMSGFFARLDRLNRRRQPRRSFRSQPQRYSRLNPTYTY